MAKQLGGTGSIIKVMQTVLLYLERTETVQQNTITNSKKYKYLGSPKKMLNSNNLFVFKYIDVGSGANCQCILRCQFFHFQILKLTSKDEITRTVHRMIEWKLSMTTFYVPCKHSLWWMYFSYSTIIHSLYINEQ